MKMAYLAQAIDYSRDGQWHPVLPPDWSYYCPHCAYVEGESDKATMSRNEQYLAKADALVAVFDGRPSFGTPVEIWTKAYTQPTRICIVHSGPPGLFVRNLISRGTIVVGSVPEAVVWLEKLRV